MDKINKYQTIICDLIAEYAAVKRIPADVKSQVLIDKENNHFQLISMGWHSRGYTYTIVFHFDIIGDKIWIQQNNTDVLIADELMQHGVDKNDIILGFIEPSMRQYSGFAMA